MTSTGIARTLRLAVDLLSAEGPRGLLERLAERGAELRERFGERRVGLDRAALGDLHAPVLDVLATPLVARGGGVPLQYRARRAEEARMRTVALLAPDAGAWTLRLTRGGVTTRTRLAPCPGVERSGWVDGGPGGGAGAAVKTVLEAARLVGAGIVNVEGAAGWSPAALRALAESGPRLVLSLHDFALFCPRPNLVEEPGARFCGYSTDAERCRACLGATWSLPPAFLAAWRGEAGALLAGAEAVVYPSPFLMRRHAELFPGARPRLARVIEPAAPGAGGEPAPATRAVGREGLARVAFVGAFRPHKGALVFLELVRASSLCGRPVRWSILGSGEPSLVRAARSAGVGSAGHFRAGSLPRRLAADGVDVALLLSIWPEAWSLTLSECRAAGVPVVAFDHGAIGERIAAEGGGVLVPVENGAEGIESMLAKVLTGEVAVPPFRGGPAESPGRRAAEERSELYRALLGGAS